MRLVTLARHQDSDGWRDAALAALGEIDRRVGVARQDPFAAARDNRYRLGRDRAKTLLSSTGIVLASGE